MENVNFLTLIETCQSINNEQRDQAEKQISVIALDNLIFILDGLASLLCTENAPENSRVYAATIIKNFVYYNEKLTAQWHGASDEQREMIKNKILSSLASNSKRVRRAACYTVATIAKIELSKGRWGEVITNLIQNSSHEQEAIQLASIQTLGDITEDIPFNLLSSETTASIVEVFILNMLNSVNNQEMVKECLKALQQSVGIAKNLYANNVSP